MHLDGMGVPVGDLGSVRSGDDNCEPSADGVGQVVGPLWLLLEWWVLL